MEEQAQGSSMIALDAEGDVILAVTDANLPPKTQSFLAASKPLMLASPYFAALLGPNFSEGVGISRAHENGAGLTPTIKLQEDDIDSMDFILSVLHHKDERIKSNMTAKQIAQIAVSAGKYQCKGALRSWTMAWFVPDRFLQDSKSLNQFDLGYRLLAAYLFRLSDIKTMLEHYIKELLGDMGAEWADDDLLSRHLPRAFRDAIHRQITNTNQQLRDLVLDTLKDLLSQADVDVDDVVSAANSYIYTLERYDVGLSMAIFQVSSPSKIVARIEEAINDLSLMFENLNGDWGFTSK